MAKLCIITCIWKRPAISLPVLGWYGRLANQSSHDISLLAVGSEGPLSREMAERCGWDYMEFPNRFMQKWNEASKASRTYDPDFVSWVGSSTAVSLLYYDRVPLREGMTGLRDMWTFDVGTQSLAYWPGYPDHQQPNAGPARFASRDVMQKLNWELWPENTWAGGLLDGGSNMSTASVSAPIHMPRMAEVDCMCVDIKSPISKSPFKDLSYRTVLKGEAVKQPLAQYELQWIADLDREG